MKSLCAKARDNARTPMQWDNSHAAGFTQSEPWYTVNTNYNEINVNKALENENSIFYYYQKLIALRKQYQILVDGTFELLCPEDEQIFAYTRAWNNQKWLIVCNFYEKPVEFEYTGKYKVILSNYEQQKVILLEKIKLRPYEAIICEMI